ncbi:DUF1830 domain-containing protein [Altericista sp. CCNU0014]|uniref:DUF1830 domain-containing protein n=1 Tax=Altericista sp. CCNU0014 TaxID=3082949 RepID=UPI00384E58EF
MSLHCSYANTTASVQIARIADFPSGYFQQVVFPGVCLLFEAPVAARLEIRPAPVVSTIVLNRIRLAFPAENCLAAQSI